MTPDLGPVDNALFGEERMRELEDMCLCPSCPAYPEEDQGEKKTYCMRGDSNHKENIDPSDCLCEQCEVYKAGRLYGRNFFCLEGAALKEGAKHMLTGTPVPDLVDQKSRLFPVLFVGRGFDVHERRPGDNDEH